MIVVLGTTDELRQILALQQEQQAQMSKLTDALKAQKDSFDKLSAAVGASTFTAQDVAGVETQTAAQDALTASLTPPSDPTGTGTGTTEGGSSTPSDPSDPSAPSS